jgi:hypothetical protein
VSCSRSQSSCCGCWCILALSLFPRWQICFSKFSRLIFVVQLMVQPRFSAAGPVLVLVFGFHHLCAECLGSRSLPLVLQWFSPRFRLPFPVVFSCEQVCYTSFYSPLRALRLRILVLVEAAALPCDLLPNHSVCCSWFGEDCCRWLLRSCSLPLMWCLYL